MCPHGLKNRDNVNQLAAVYAGHNRAPIDENGRTVKIRHGHQTARHVFVATTNGNQSVKTFGPCHRLDRIGNDLAGNQGITHPQGSHRNAVRNRYGIEYDGLASGIIHAAPSLNSELINVHIARCNHAPCRGNAHDWLLEVLILETNRPEHGAAWSALSAFYEYGRVFSQVVF